MRTFIQEELEFLGRFDLVQELCEEEDYSKAQEVASDLQGEKKQVLETYIEERLETEDQGGDWNDTEYFLEKLD